MRRRRAEIVEQGVSCDAALGRFGGCEGGGSDETFDLGEKGVEFADGAGDRRPFGIGIMGRQPRKADFLVGRALHQERGQHGDLQALDLVHGMALGVARQRLHAGEDETIKGLGAEFRINLLDQVRDFGGLEHVGFGQGRGDEREMRAGHGDGQRPFVGAGNIDEDDVGPIVSAELLQVLAELFRIRRGDRDRPRAVCVVAEPARQRAIAVEINHMHDFARFREGSGETSGRG